MSDTEKIFNDIQEFLREEQKILDRFLTDFRQGWQGTMRDSEDGSVLDGPLPQAVIDAHYRLHGPESNYSGQQQVKAYQARVGSVFVNASDMACLIEQSVARIRLDNPADVRALAQALNAAADQMTAVPAPPATVVGGSASSNRSYSQNELVIQSSEQRKSRFEQNLKEMEKYARQSAFEYPRGG